MASVRRLSYRTMVPRVAPALGLILSLVLGVSIMAVALGSGEYPWLTWVSLLALLLAIGIASPRKAMLCGALWGVCLHLFSVGGVGTRVWPAMGSLALLITVPALCAYLGARLTSRIGFAPLVLGTGWVGIALILQPLVLHNNLVGGPHIQSLAPLMAGLFGYLLVALLVTCAHAWLLSIAGDLRFRIPQPRFLWGPHDSGEWLPWETSSLDLPLRAIRASQPRAPPVSPA